MTTALYITLLTILLFSAVIKSNRSFGKRVEADLRQRKIDENDEIDYIKTINKYLANLVILHKEVLILKRRQGIFQDDYGIPDDKKWMADVIYFANTVCGDVVINHYTLIYGDKSPGYKELRNDVDRILDSLDENEKLFNYNPSMTGIEFELLVADRLKIAGAEVSFTPVSGDQGADLIVTYKGRDIAIQCKRSSGTVGNKAVQEAYAGSKYYSANEAWVVSDAAFSRSARQLASQLSVLLVDYTQIETYL